MIIRRGEKVVVSQSLRQLIRYLFPRFSLFIPLNPTFCQDVAHRFSPVFPRAWTGTRSHRVPRNASIVDNYRNHRQVDGIATRKEKERGRKRAFPSDSFILSTTCLVSILRNMRNNPPTGDYYQVWSWKRDTVHFFSIFFCFVESLFRNFPPFPFFVTLSRISRFVDCRDQKTYIF